MKNERSIRSKMLGLIVYTILALAIVIAMGSLIFSRREEQKAPVTSEAETGRKTESRAPSAETGSEPSREPTLELFEPVTGLTGGEPSSSEGTENAEPEKAAEETTASAQKESAQKSLRFILPVDGFLTKTHSADLLVYSQTMNDYRVHLGVDLAAEEGAPVFACEDGVVESVVEEMFMGTTVVLDHGQGIKSSCKNLSETLPEGIAPGAYVTKGQVIGAVGETALIEVADQPHLHFEMTLNGEKVDPLAYIPAPAAAMLQIDTE